jgi:hypothetical protein
VSDAFEMSFFNRFVNSPLAAPDRALLDPLKDNVNGRGLSGKVIRTDVIATAGK